MTDGDPEASLFSLTVADALAGLGRAAWNDAARSGRLELLELVSVGCATQHGLPPLPPPEGSLRPGRIRAGRGTEGLFDGLSGGDRAVLDFALQFSLDVSSVSEEQRSALGEELGAQTATVTAVIFVMDFLPRSRAALDALGGDAPCSDLSMPHTVSDGAGVWDALIAFARAVPRLEALDPVTTELVRLRGARQHRCRLCTSLRSRPALLAGADEELFLEVDEYEQSDLSPLQKAALAVADAMIWTPAAVGESASRLAEVASGDQQVEVVLDVTRNALNKVAVALGADAAHVDEGVEIYDIDANGDPVFGLTLDGVDAELQRSTP